MSKKPLILGIESSCDETAASIISENELGNPVVLSNIVSSQVDVHKEFGGVVPELAARSHIEKIDWIVQKAIDDSGKNIDEIDAIASTAGPGLIVCLSVGLSFGKAFAASLKKPFIAVNHLEGHALSPRLNSKLNYPYLLLLISGGHSQYLSVKNLSKYKNSINIVTTHYDYLTKLDKYNWFNYYFQGSIIDNNISYDYKLKEGKCNSHIALKILEKKLNDKQIINDATKIFKKLKI